MIIEPAYPVQSFELSKDDELASQIVVFQRRIEVLQEIIREEENLWNRHVLTQILKETCEKHEERRMTELLVK